MAVKRSSSSSTPTPPRPPPSSSTPSLLPPDVAYEVARQETLWRVFTHKKIGVLLEELGQSLGFDTGPNTTEPSSSDLEKVVEIHRSLKEAGISRQDLITAMQGLGELFDPNRPSPLFAPSPPSSLPPRSPSKPAPPPLSAKPRLKHKKSSTLPSPPIVKPRPKLTVTDLGRWERELATLQAKLKEANPGSAQRKILLSSLTTLQTRISKFVLSAKEEKVASELSLLEDLDSKEGGSRIATRRSFVQGRLNDLETGWQTGLGDAAVELEERRLEWKVLLGRGPVKAIKKDASKSIGSTTSSPLLPRPSTPPSASSLPITSIHLSPSSESSSPLLSPTPPSSPTPAPPATRSSPLLPSTTRNSHTSLPSSSPSVARGSDS